MSEREQVREEIKHLKKEMEQSKRPDKVKEKLIERYEHLGTMRKDGE